jgi:hypothetical protein
MKIKVDFVTNSSSASFTINKKDLTKRQIMLIKNHIEVARMLTKIDKKERWYDPWTIWETKKHISGSTFMDNFDMAEFLKIIGVEGENIVIRDYDIDPESSQDIFKVSKGQDLVNYFMKYDDNPCKYCVVLPMCKKLVEDGSLCDEMIHFIFTSLEIEVINMKKEGVMEK